MISTEQSGLLKQSAHVLNTTLAHEGKVATVALGDPHNGGHSGVSAASTLRQVTMKAMKKDFIFQEGLIPGYRRST